MKYILVCFAFMAFAFYELSGGDDFTPRKAEMIAQVEAERAAKAEDRAERVAVRETSQDKPATPAKPSTDASLVTVALVTATAAPAAETPAAAAPRVVTREERLQPTLISLEQSSDLFARPLVRLEDDSQTETQELLTKDIRQVTANRVNMRNGPGTSFGVLTKLTRGTEVEVLSTNGEGWVKLRTVDDQIVGWMAAYLLTEPTG
jgi:hypothetical protein